jgi:putative FmdB family regulatory protein
MPTYDYQCSKCGHKFEKFQSIMSSPLRKCPECGKNTLKRLIGTGAGLIFKGSGFYITDYRSESYKDGAKADTSGKPAESKTGDSKPSETKAGESKPSESKPSESKPAETKASDSKPSESKASSSDASSKAPAPKSEPAARRSSKKR